MAEQNEKMIEKVIAQHKEKRESFQEVKKMKMDYLYDQMVSFQQNVDTAKEVLEKAAKDLDELDAIAFLVVSLTNVFVVFLIRGFKGLCKQNPSVDCSLKT